MGLQIRKRTKGKSGWWNGSYSKRGVGVSGSFKIGENITVNTGDLSGNKKNRGRTTLNFGNGIKWVSYNKSAKKRPTKQPIYYHDSVTWSEAIMGFLKMLFVIAMIPVGIMVLMGVAYAAIDSPEMTLIIIGLVLVALWTYYNKD